MGHEIAGVIAEIGENISELKLNDIVVCFTVAFDVSGGKLTGLGTFQDGGFAEYVKVPKEWVFKIPKNISIKESVLLETFALAMRALKLSRIENTENILIIGGGNVGLCFLKALLIEKNPNYITIVEPHEFLRNKAIEIGASYAVAPSRAKIRKITKKFGDPTFIFDCVGNEETISNSVNYIKKGGTILLEGIHKGSITFPMFMINSKEVTLKGCLGHDRDDILAAVDLFANNKVDASTFISDVVPLKNIQKTFERYLEPADNRNFIKILVEI